MNSPFPYERLPLKEEFFGRTQELEKTFNDCEIFK